MVVKNIEKVKIEELGFYLKLIRDEYGILSNERYADLITEEFNIQCDKEDIDKYEMLHVELEDYEKLSRMSINGNVEHLIE